MHTDTGFIQNLPQVLIKDSELEAPFATIDSCYTLNWHAVQRMFSRCYLKIAQARSLFLMNHLFFKSYANCLV